MPLPEIQSIFMTVSTSETDSPNASKKIPAGIAGHLAAYGLNSAPRETTESRVDAKTLLTRGNGERP